MLTPTRICNGPMCNGVAKFPGNFYMCRRKRYKHCKICCTFLDIKPCNGPLCNGKILPRHLFHKDKNRQDGLYPYCVKCTSKVKKDRYHRDKPKVAARCKANYQLHKEEHNAHSREYYNLNKDWINPKKNITTAKWAKKHPEKRAEARRKRRARVLDVDTEADWQTTLKAFHGQCANCHSTEHLCKDHHRPLSKGYALSLENCVPLCCTCNLRKSTKDPEEFYGVKICRRIDKKLRKLAKSNK